MFKIGPIMDDLIKTSPGHSKLGRAIGALKEINSDVHWTFPGIFSGTNGRISDVQ